MKDSQVQVGLVLIIIGCLIIAAKVTAGGIMVGWGICELIKGYHGK